MTEVVAFDARYFGGRVGTGVDDIVGDPFAVVLNGLNITVEPGLCVQRARNTNLEHHVTVLRHQFQPLQRGAVSRLVQRLTYISQTPVGAAGWYVRVESDHWNPGVHGRGRRRVKRFGVDEAYGDAVRFFGN